MRVYLVKTGRSVSMVCGSVSPEAYVAGPYASVDDAEAALRARKIKDEIRESAISAALIMVVFTAVLFLVTPTLP